MLLEGKSVLVTGGTGFIGGRLVEKLVVEHHARVRVLVRNFKHAARIARLPVEMLAGDIMDRTAVQKAAQGCDIVFHSAFDFASRYRQKQVGVQGTQNVGQAVLLAGVSRMVHVSSFGVYAPMSDGKLTESSPWPRSSSIYEVIKRQAERVVLDMHRTKGLPVVVVQPTLVYGPFSTWWTMAPIRNLKTGLVPLVNGGAGYCNAVYIDDVIDAMTLAATQPDVLGETFLISAEEPVTWKAFYGAFEAALGIHSTVDVSEEELTEALRKRRHRSRTIPMLISLARNPQVLSELARLPLLQTSLRLLNAYLSEKRWRSLKTWAFASGSRNHEQKLQSDKSICVPDESLLALYRSQTRVCIDKAKKRLGYLPKFDFERGMDLTTRFLHWANLA